MIPIKGNCLGQSIQYQQIILGISLHLFVYPGEKISPHFPFSLLPTMRILIFRLEGLKYKT